MSIEFTVYLEEGADVSGRELGLFGSSMILPNTCPVVFAYKVNKHESLSKTERENAYPAGGANLNIPNNFIGLRLSFHFFIFRSTPLTFGSLKNTPKKFY